MKKRNVSGSATNSTAKRTRVEAEEQSITTSVEEQIYTTWAHTVSLWPEVQELCPNGTLSQQLVALQNKASEYFLHSHDLTFDSYCRLNELEGYLQELDAEADRCRDTSLHRDLRASLEVAAILPITLLQIRFDMATARPALLDEAIRHGKAAAALHMSGLSDEKRELISDLERMREGRYLNDTLINFLAEQWAVATNPSIKIDTTWGSSTHLLYLPHDAPRRSDSGEPRDHIGHTTYEAIKKKSLWGCGVNQPDNWTRLFMPIHKDKLKHWVVAVADFSEGKVTVLDSLGPDGEYDSKICTILTEILKALWHHYGLTGLNLTPVISKISRQSNTVDCGVHAMAWMEYLAGGGPFPQGRQDVFPFINLREGVSALSYRLYFVHQILQFLELI